MKTTNFCIALFAAALGAGAGCSSPPVENDVVTADAQGGTDVQSGSDVQGGNDVQPGTDAGGGFMAFEPCMNEADYTAGNAVTFPAGGGFAYAPRCLTVSAGAMVTFTGMFSAHPLAPSTRGTAGNPITATMTGTTASFTFANPGFYPYFCTLHGSDMGTGMAGVIRVVP